MSDTSENAVQNRVIKAYVDNKFSETVSGTTPSIGSNGNWYIGSEDTGKPSRGEKGEKGDKGDTGQAYTLTADDKSTIVNAVLAALPAAEGVSY